MSDNKLLSPDDLRVIRGKIRYRLEGIEQLSEVLSQLQVALHYLDEDVYGSKDKREFAYVIEQIRLTLNEHNEN